MFAQPGYRRLWTARTVSQWGDVFRTVALSLLIYRLTGSGFGVAGVVLAEIIPVLLLAPFAGPIIDRVNPVRVMIVADLIRAGLIGLLAFQHDSPALVYAVAFGMSVGSTFFNPAAGATLPTLVSKNSLVAANSGIWTAAVLSQIALAPLAGLLVTTGGYTAAFTVNAISFILSALALTRLPKPTAPPAVGQRHLLAQAREGVTVITRHPTLRALAAGQLLAALSAGATSALLVVLASEHLDVGASGYGTMIAAIGIGAAAGPLLLLRLIKAPQRPIFVFGPYALRGVTDLVLAATTLLPVAVVALAVYGLGTSTGAVTFNSLLQAEAPERVRGRVFASMDVLWQTGRLLSLGVGATLAELVGIPAVYVLGGVLLLLAAALGLTTTRQARPSPQPPADKDAAVNVTLLYFDGCPNWQQTEQRLLAALEQAGLPDTVLTRQAVDTPEDAELLAFRGSPTVLINGDDPFADPSAPDGLSCRIFQTPDGLAGAPTVEQLVSVLR